MISSYALFFSTAGAVNAYNENTGSWKNSMFWLGNNHSCFRIILEFREFWNQIPWCRSTYIELLNASQLRWSNFQARMLFQWLRRPFRLWALAACPREHSFLLSGAVLHSCWLCSFLHGITPVLSEPWSCVCGVGQVLQKKPAANKRAFLWLAVWTKPHQLHLHREELCATLFPHRPETIFCLYNGGISFGYSYLK